MMMVLQQIIDVRAFIGDHVAHLQNAMYNTFTVSACQSLTMCHLNYYHVK